MKQLILLFLVSLSCTAFAQKKKVLSQTDSLIIESRDTIQLKSYAKRYDPQRALLLAAVVPGLGQIYNKKYWKLPLVAGGFIGIGYGFNSYNNFYQKYKKELFYNLENGFENDSDSRGPGEPTTGNYRTAVDFYRNKRDLMVLLMGGMYLLQIIDAHVDAHLKEFDLNPNLQVSIQPSVSQNDLIGRQTGVSVVFKF
ncbi:MAG TPA: DUF5683 domain-containing protein [Chryseolinea sp.]|nr:DUF5683 domain-containing protein [Chryseolinea sp.]HPH46205.1 DUF5683 domain-containing protein [Chryseolinea sp.]HPM32675.1 DUF5683 domain-containing protein [Chryseolinea sp.]